MLTDTDIYRQDIIAALLLNTPIYDKEDVIADIPFDIGHYDINNNNQWHWNDITVINDNENYSTPFLIKLYFTVKHNNLNYFSSNLIMDNNDTIVGDTTEKIENENEKKEMETNQNKSTQSLSANQIIDYLLQHIEGFKTTVYDNDTHYGLFKNTIVRLSNHPTSVNELKLLMTIYPDSEKYSKRSIVFDDNIQNDYLSFYEIPTYCTECVYRTNTISNEKELDALCDSIKSNGNTLHFDKYRMKV